MSKIVILGSSIAGVKIAEEILSVDSSHEVTIIAYDGYYPHDRELFPDFLSGKLKASEIFYKAKDFYTEKGINLILDKKVTRVNLARKKVFAEDRSQTNFDILVVTESVAHRFSDLKGSHRKRLFGMKKLKDIEKINEEMPFFLSVAIQSDQFSGIRMAQAFVEKEKETILIVSEDGNYFGSLEDDMLVKLNEKFSEKKLSIIKDNGVIELLGEKEVKAVRLSSGKVLASEVFVLGNAPDDMRTFADQELDAGKAISVDTSFKSNVDDVYAIDYACECAVLADRQEDFMQRDILEEHGVVLAKTILGSDAFVEKKFSVKEISLEDVSFVFIGDTHREDGVLEHFSSNTDDLSYEKIFVKDDKVVGAILINNEDQVEKLSHIIKDELSVKSIESYLLDRKYTYNNSESVSDELNSQEEQSSLPNENTLVS